MAFLSTYFGLGQSLKRKIFTVAMGPAAVAIAKEKKEGGELAKEEGVLSLEHIVMRSTRAYRSHAQLICLVGSK